MSTALPGAVAGRVDTGRSLRLSSVSDELLARYAARGSRRAFGVLYERYHQPLYRYCRSIVRNEGDAHDVLQSAFTSALAALLRGGRNAPLRPWLYKIAHNEAVSLLRRRTRDAAAPMEDAILVASSAEDEAEGRARWQGLLEDLAELPERQRGALLLREMAGLSHEEIAVALSLTVGAAKQAIFEARQGLAEVEEGRAMSCEEVRRRVSAGDRRVLRARRVRSHLRGCAGCDAFASGISTRQADLRALAPLPPAAAAAILGHVLRATAPQGGTAAVGSAATAGAIGKATGAVAGKAIAGAALVTTAAAGVAGLTHVIPHHHAAAPVVSQVHRSEPAPTTSTLHLRASSSSLVGGGTAARSTGAAVGAAHAAGGHAGTGGHDIRMRTGSHRAWAGPTDFHDHGESGGRWAAVPVGHDASAGGGVTHEHGAAASHPDSRGSGTHGDKGSTVGYAGGSATSHSGGSTTAHSDGSTHVMQQDKAAAPRLGSAAQRALNSVPPRHVHAPGAAWHSR